MKLLLDTNIFLEIILEQNRSEEARALLGNPREEELFLSDYSLHSIGLLLFRRREHEVFQKFLNDIVINAGVAVISLLAEELDTVVTAAHTFNLDFDDAYQYAVAEKYNLTLVSFDADFDRTERRRKTPADFVEK